MKKALILAICIAIACCLIAIPILLNQANPPYNLDIAIENAIDFMDKSREPYGLLMLDVIYRRFGIEEFADSLQIYDQELGNLTHRAPILRVFRRIADHDNPLQVGDLDSVVNRADQITVPALYCDRYGIPDYYQSTFEDAVFSGEGWLAHALLAWIWIQENGCTLPLPEGFIEGMYQGNAALIDDDEVVDDLELEAAAFLYIAGRGNLVDKGFLQRTLEVQNEDGGWFLSSDKEDFESSWHTTVLALLYLLHIKYPVDSYPPMLDPD
jgi:hypothetical protein